MYLTYQEYQEMGGTLDEATYNDLEFEAEALINWYTFNRLRNNVTIPDEVKRLVKYLVNIAAKQISILGTNLDTPTATSSESMIASQSNDGVSISYNVLSASQVMESLKNQEDKAIRQYLQGVTNEAGRKLLYRGLYPGE